MTDTTDLIANWPADPVARLRHILDLYPNRHDDDMAIEGLYRAGVRAGLTWGDLRSIAERLGSR